MLFLRGREVGTQRERAGDMKRRNDMLIRNILPPHVAVHFLSRAHHHDDLYSQSYAEVGVLFASIPNFADFYTEETINNQGLECLRFLNEVISDFDAVSCRRVARRRRSSVRSLLLPMRPGYIGKDTRAHVGETALSVFRTGENRIRFRAKHTRARDLNFSLREDGAFAFHPTARRLRAFSHRFSVPQILDQIKFKDTIIKIKTIGSTYMAASGITESAETQDGPRWGHLSTLVEFSLEMKKALSNINEQSFNHFVLKMGINHGPVTAGVIGARKPHYDIWGNTVNVASRMESTGKVGCLQVSMHTRKGRARARRFYTLKKILYVVEEYS